MCGYVLSAHFIYMAMVYQFIFQIIKNKKERLHALFLHTNHLNLGAYSKIKTHFFKIAFTLGKMKALTH